MGGEQGGRAVALGQHCPWQGSSMVQTGESGGRGRASGKPMAHSLCHHAPPPPQPLSKGRKPKALTQKTLAYLLHRPPQPTPRNNSITWRPVALSPGWADRLDGEGREACLGRGRGDMEKSEQGLKNEEINLPGGRQPRPVLHKAVLGPPRMLAGGGGRSWLLPGPLPPLPSWVPAPHW